MTQLIFIKKKKNGVVLLFNLKDYHLMFNLKEKLITI